MGFVVKLCSRVDLHVIRFNSVNCWIYQLYLSNIKVFQLIIGFPDKTDIGINLWFIDQSIDVC